MIIYTLAMFKPPSGSQFMYRRSTPRLPASTPHSAPHLPHTLPHIHPHPCVTDAQMRRTTRRGDERDNVRTCSISPRSTRQPHCRRPAPAHRMRACAHTRRWCVVCRRRPKYAARRKARCSTGGRDGRALARPGDSGAAQTSRRGMAMARRRGRRNGR